MRRSRSIIYPVALAFPLSWFRGGQQAIRVVFACNTRILAPVFGRAYSRPAALFFLTHKIKIPDRAAQTDDKGCSERLQSLAYVADRVGSPSTRCRMAAHH